MSPLTAVVIVSGVVFLLSAVALVFETKRDRYLPSKNTTSWSTNGIHLDAGPVPEGFIGSFMEHHLKPTLVPNVADTTTEICEATTGIAQTGPTDFKIVDCGKSK